MDGHFKEDAYGRSWKIMDDHFSEDANRRWLDVGWMLSGSCGDAQPTFEDSGKNRR